MKRLVAHADDCMYRDENPPDSFYVQGEVIYRDLRGRKGGTNWSWQTFLCSDPDCPGMAAVRRDVFVELIAEALRGR